MNNSPLPTIDSGEGRHATAPFSRRALLVSALALPTLAAVIAGCGDPTVQPTDTAVVPDTTGGTTGSTDVATTEPAAGFDHAIGASDVILRLGFEGGFVPSGFAFLNPASLIISGDGMAYTPAPTTLQFPGPLVAPMAVRSITEAGIQKLLSAANAAGLLAAPPDYVVESFVADAPNTVVTITAGGVTYQHSAYALGMATDDSGQQALEASPARQALFDFVQLLGDLSALVGESELGAETIFEPVAYRLRAEVVAEDSIAGFDPAPTIADWPASTGLDLATAAECATLSALEAGSVFSDANSNTFFRLGGVLYSLFVAGVLPGDPAC